MKINNYSGCRIVEILALTVGDIKENALIINKSKNQSGIITLPKTPKSNRTVTIPSSLSMELKQYIKKLQDSSNNAQLFNVAGRNNINKFLKRYAAIAGLPLIRVHDLRYSHASLLINNNVSPVAISERLGHEKVETTLNIYSHLYQTTVDKINDILENSIKTVSI